MRKQAAFVIKDGELYWCFGKKWEADINNAITYFSQDNAERKGPGKGKVVPAVIESTVKEVK